jgi:hypothetical protein
LASEPKTLRRRLANLPLDYPLPSQNLRACQVEGITNLEESLAAAHPRALIQMATGSGKTFTAITAIYRLLKHVRVKRVLFLVDTRNLGEQAEQEFLAYQPSDDNRKFTELYTVQRLTSSHVPGDAQVCISTIQRMYSILQGKALDESAEDENPGERRSTRKEPLPVTYNEKVPIEHFDLIIIDECHRSIYKLGRQVLGVEHPVDELTQRLGWHLRIGVDLPVGMRDRRSDLGAAVLEDQHVVDVVTGAELCGALRPQVHDAAGAVDAERPELGAVVRGVEHHLAAAVGHRRPAVREAADVVGLGRLEAAGAERALSAGQVRPLLARVHDDGGSSGELVEALVHLHRRAR